MARFDVHRDLDGPGYLLDCQADILSHLATRLVVQLVPAKQAALISIRLNPAFAINGRPHVMLTQLAAAVKLSRLGPLVTSLKDQDFTITKALDMLLTGI